MDSFIDFVHNMGELVHIDKKKFAEKSKEYSNLNEIIKEANQYSSFETDKKELEKIINDNESEVDIIFWHFSPASEVLPSTF